MAKTSATRATLAVLTLLHMLATSTSAAEPPPGSSLKDFMLPEQIPDATSLIVLGLSLQQTIQTRPSVVLSPQLLTGADSRGVLQTGVALQTKPLLFWRRRAAAPPPDKDNFSSKLIRQLRDSFEVSAAATKAASNGDEALQLALGFSVTPFDLGVPWENPNLKKCIRSSDPRTSLLKVEELAQSKGNFQDKELKRIATKMASLAFQRDGLRTDFAPEAIVTLIDGEMDDEVEKYSARCRARAHFELWNASRWSIGVAPKWMGRDGTAGDLQWNTAALWTTVAYGFESFAETGPTGNDFASKLRRFITEDVQLLAGFHFRPDELISVLDSSDGNGLRTRDTIIASGQVRWGVRFQDSDQVAAKLVLGLEALYEHVDEKGGRGTRDSQRLSMSVDYSIFRTASLNLTFGGSTVGGGETNDAFIMSTLKFGF
jgi:hypothetical protein